MNAVRVHSVSCVEMTSAPSRWASSAAASRSATEKLTCQCAPPTRGYRDDDECPARVRHGRNAAAGDDGGDRDLAARGAARAAGRTRAPVRHRGDLGGGLRGADPRAVGGPDRGAGGRGRRRRAVDRRDRRCVRRHRAARRALDAHHHVPQLLRRAPRRSRDRRGPRVPVAAVAVRRPDRSGGDPQPGRQGPADRGRAGRARPAPARLRRLRRLDVRPPPVRRPGEHGRRQRRRRARAHGTGGLPRGGPARGLRPRPGNARRLGPTRRDR